MPIGFAIHLVVYSSAPPDFIPPPPLVVLDPGLELPVGAKSAVGRLRACPLPRGVLLAEATRTGVLVAYFSHPSKIKPKQETEQPNGNRIKGLDNWITAFNIYTPKQ